MNALPAGELAPVPIPERRFDIWTLDFITGLPSDGGFNAVMVCVDKLTKLVKIVPCSTGEGELTAPVVARLFFSHIVRNYGVPRFVLHDRDPRFTSAFW